jgi:hypothetical protein
VLSAKSRQLSSQNSVVFFSILPGKDRKLDVYLRQ